MSLPELLAYLVAAVIAVPVSRRLGFGSVLGYLAAGIAIGPWGMRLIGDVDRVLHLSEFGIVLLLFIIGLELQPSRLRALRRAVFATGTLQFVVSGAVLAGAALAFGVPWQAAMVIGPTLALSSTALVLQVLAERSQLTTRHGRTAFAILLLQDLAVIPLLALIPALAGSSIAVTESPAASLALQAGAVALLVLGGRKLLRPLFRIAARDGGQEIFTATALLVVVGASLLMVQVGLSAAMGAFLAGVLLADSEFRHELEAEIDPFKGLLLGLFFVAVGMSANLGLLAEHPARLVAITLCLLVLKAAVLYGVGRASGLEARPARSLALVLSQGGEFAFVLLAAAMGGALIGRDLFDLLVLVVTLSMAATPLLVILDERVNRRFRPAGENRPYDTVEERDHDVIIAGLGRFGQIVGRILKMRGIPFTALESDARQVDIVRRYGNVVYYGDSTRIELLRAAKVNRAKLFVVAVEHVEESVRTVELVKRHFPHLKVFARARDRVHARALLDLKVDYVIRETYVSSLELSEQVLRALGDAPERARHSVERFREFDERLLVQEVALHQDEGRLIQNTIDARRELAFLFASDQVDAQLASREEKP